MAAMLNAARGDSRKCPGEATIAYKILSPARSCPLHLFMIERGKLREFGCRLPGLPALKPPMLSL